MLKEKDFNSIPLLSGSWRDDSLLMEIGLFSYHKMFRYMNEELLCIYMMTETKLKVSRFLETPLKNLVNSWKLQSTILDVKVMN